MNRTIWCRKAMFLRWDSCWRSRARTRRIYRSRSATRQSALYSASSSNSASTTRTTASRFPRNSSSKSTPLTLRESRWAQWWSSTPTPTVCSARAPRKLSWRGSRTFIRFFFKFYKPQSHFARLWLGVVFAARRIDVDLSDRGCEVARLKPAVKQATS